MTDKTMAALLEDLHQRLTHGAALDPEARRLVQVVLADLGRAGAVEEHHRSLRELAVVFEIEHPDLAEGLRRLATMLSGAGV